MTLYTDVQAQITAAQTFASDAFDDASALVSEAQTAAQGFINLAVPEIDFSVDPLDKGVVDANKPGAFEDSFVTPDNTDITTPTFESLYIPELPDFPDAPGALDTTGLFNQSRPDFDVTPFDDTAPAIDTNISLPDQPDVDLPAEPDSEASSLTAPKVATPTFDKEFDGVRPDAIGDLAARYELEYNNLSPVMREALDAYADAWLTKINPEFHNQLAALEAKVAEGVEGGKGLSDEYEQRVFDRARARIESQARTAERELGEAHARRGFVIPPGSMMGGIVQTRQSVIQGVSEAAATTAIDRATRELQHAQFSMTLSQGIRQAMVSASLSYMGNLISINGQALEYAKQAAQSLVDAYNAALALYDTDRQIYETESRVFTTRLESAFAELRSFEAQLNAIRTQTEVEQLEVEKYVQLVQAQRTKIDLYLAQIEGVAKQNDLKRLQLEIFAEKVKAYIGRVQGKEAEFNAYRAAIAGDEARVRAYSEEVRAYASQVDGAKAKVSAEVEHSRAISDYNRNLVSQFEAKITQYRAELEAEGKRFDSSVDAHKAALDRYRTILEGELKLVDTEYERDRLLLDAERARHRGEVEIAGVNGNLFVQRLKLRADTAVSGANVLGDLASAALTAQNSMMTLSAAET